MKKISVFYIISILLVGSFILPTFASATEDNGQYPNPIYTYGVTAGDEYIFDFLLNITAGFENQTVYSEIESWLNETYSTDEFAEIQDSWAIFTGLIEFINQDVQVNVTITDMYAEWSNYTTWSDETKYKVDDVFNGSIRVRDNGDETWLTPSDLAKNRVDEFAQFVVDNSNLTIDSTEVVNYKNMSKAEIDAEAPNWNNIEISRVGSVFQMYDENGTIKNPEDYSDYDPLAPTLPIAGFEPKGLPLFLPTDFNFSEWLDFAEASFNYEENTTTFDEASTNIGITTLSSNQKGIAVVFNTQNMDEEFMLEQFDINMTEMDDYLKDFQVIVYFALEYDADFALASEAVYIDISFKMDTTQAIADGEDAPIIVNEPFHMYYVQNLHQDRFKTPTPEQIELGEVGDERNMNAGGFLGFDIPGYSGWLVGIIGLISISAIIYKKKH